MSEIMDRNRITALAERLKALLEEYLAEDAAAAAPHMEEARRVKEEIEKMGFVVTWNATQNFDTGKCVVEIKLWEPKKEMTPENALAFDEWFLKRWNIKAPNKEGGNR